MKFGKLNDISEVDFRLPADPADTTNWLADLPFPKERNRVYIGCTGWSMKEWVGPVYPKGTKAKDYLVEYGKQFNTIELNTTHYRIPSASLVEKWMRETPGDFRFCPKVPQVISHARDLGINSGRLLEFASALEDLLPKLGACFMQFPPYVSTEHQSRILQFLDHWPSHLPLSLELRHESWFKEDSASSAFFAELRKRGIGMVITDVAGRRDVLHQQLCADQIMVRFVGNAVHPTDYERIDAWVVRLQQWLQAGINDIYFFPHEPDNILAPDLCLYLRERLQSFPVIETRGPSLPPDDSGSQMALF